MKTEYDFGFGLVPAHQHPNGGGWVADTATVDPTAYVGPNAKVFGKAMIHGNATVAGDAQVFDNAAVSGNAIVTGNPKVHGNAQVSGDAWVNGAIRSDFYQFILVPCSDNIPRIIAGCRYFTIEDAFTYWNETHPKYLETKIILDYLVQMGKMKGIIT